MVWTNVAIMLLNMVYKSKRGRPLKNNYGDYLEKIEHVLRTGIQWKYLKGPLHWSTYYKAFSRWNKLKIFENSFRIIQKILKKQKYLNKECYKNLYVDSSMIKNVRGSDCTGVNHYDRGRKGSKISIIVTRTGIPLGIKIKGSNVHDVRIVESLIDNLEVKIVGSRLIADKGYISNTLKTRLNNRGIRLIYPPRSNQNMTNSEEETRLLKTRNIVENVFSWQQNNRHLKLRYDRLIRNYEGFYYIGLMRIIDRKIDY